MLEREYEFFEEHRAEMVRDHLGEFVVISGDEVIDYWPTFDAAVEGAYRRTRKTTFLVKEVAEHDEPVLIPTYVLASR